MNGKAKRQKNQYQNEWRKKNRDKVRQYNERYWEKKAEQADRQIGTETDDTEKNGGKQ